MTNPYDPVDVQTALRQTVDRTRAFANGLERVQDRLETTNKALSQALYDERSVREEVLRMYDTVMPKQPRPAGVLTAVALLCEQLEVLKATAEALYFAARWTTDALDQPTQARLWENLRDALELPPGSATAKGLGDPAQTTGPCGS